MEKETFKVKFKDRMYSNFVLNFQLSPSLCLKLGLRFFPLSPKKPACQRGEGYWMTEEGCWVQLASCPVQKGQCLRYSPLSHPWIWAKFHPSPIYLLSYQPRPSAGCQHLCHCVHCTFWFYSTFLSLIECCVCVRGAGVRERENFLLLNIWYTCKKFLQTSLRLFL